MSSSLNLLCDEALEELPKTPGSTWTTPTVSRAPQQQQQQQQIYPDLPPTVKAIQDEKQVKDNRILQNLLRNQEKYLPKVKDFLRAVQSGVITAEMRKIVGEWMRDVVMEENCTADVYTLSMNTMDRFLSQCRVIPSQLQLLGSVCVMIASKIREPCPISGRNLITYTDYSITVEELKDWELLVLYKLQWELSAITALDYLDHVLPRIAPTIDDDDGGVDLSELRKYAETVLVLVANEYRFSSYPQSLLAASSIVIAAKSLSSKLNLREVKLSLQTITLSATDHIDSCIKEISAILPNYLKSTTTKREADSTVGSPKNPEKSKSQCSSPVPDLICSEEFLGEDEDYDEEGNNSSKDSSGASSDFSSILTHPDDSRSSSPLSAVDIFTEFNTGVLQAVFEQAENQIDPQFSILVS